MQRYKIILNYELIFFVYKLTSLFLSGNSPKQLNDYQRLFNITPTHLLILSPVSSIPSILPRPSRPHLPISKSANSLISQSAYPLSSAQAQEIHAHIRSLIAKKYGAQVAEDCTILYGGSCNAGNAKELFSQPDVDGGLIGGASLSVEKFLPIIEAFN